MKSGFVFFLCVSVFLFPGPSSAFDPEAETEIISAEGIRALQAAMPEFERKGLDLSRYRAEIVRFDTTIAVIFIDRNVSPEEARYVYGSPGEVAAFGVEMNREDFQVIRAHFQK
ncbi:MAG: hypothetical protein RH982_06295 [Parvibaculum sp.]